MKKKIKDITIAEYKRICTVYHCSDCPLYNWDEDLKEVQLCVLDFPDGHFIDFLEKEVEIPEEVFGISEQEEEEE